MGFVLTKLFTIIHKLFLQSKKTSLNHSCDLTLHPHVDRKKVIRLSTPPIYQRTVKSKKTRLEIITNKNSKSLTLETILFRRKCSLHETPLTRADIKLKSNFGSKKIFIYKTNIIQTIFLI